MREFAFRILAQVKLKLFTTPTTTRTVIINNSAQNN